MTKIEHRTLTLAGKAILILLLVFAIPNPISNRAALVGPAHATALTGLSVWSSVYNSRSVLDTTLVANKFLVMRLNVSGGVPLDGFDVKITWDPAVMMGYNLSITGGIFDLPTFQSLAREIQPDHVRWAGVVGGTHVTGSGMIFAFGVQILAPGSTQMNIDPASQLTQPSSVPYVISNGFFSNSPTVNDLVLTSMFVKNETAVPGDKETVAVGIRNIGPAVMTGVTVTLVANFTTTPIPLGSTSVGAVASNSAQSVNVVWDTTGFALGVYNLNATVTTTSTSDAFAGDNFLALEQVKLVIHDLAVTSLTAPASARVNSTVTLNLVLQNLGTIQDTANVTVYLNNILRVRVTSSNQTWQTFLLDPETTSSVAMSWNTTLFPVGSYVLKAAVKPVPGEVPDANDNFTDGTIVIKSRFDHDLGITGSLPGSAIVGQNVTLTFQIKNNGLSSDTYTAGIFLNTQTLFTSSGTLASLATAPFTFTWNTRTYSPGTYTLIANVTITPVTTIDEFPANNQIRGGFTLFADQPPVPVIDVKPAVPEPGLPTVLNGSRSFSPQQNFLSSYAWTFGDGTADAVGVIVNHTFSTSGTYTVTLTVTDNFGGSTSKSMQLRVNSLPVAKFSVSTTTTDTGTDVSFDASSSTDSDGTVTSYSWDFGDGSTGSGKTLTHAFSASGDYTVKLNVTDNDGASNVSTLTIHVNPAPLIPLVVVYALSAAGVGAALIGGLLFLRRRKSRVSTPVKTRP